VKRKIAAIFAADIAGYSRLVAEDEEETLRRLAPYRQVTDDFIARYGGRIFNTAGDAVLAEFSSAVEAVGCAIDIQESLRTRNMAYPSSCHMSFRIGIAVGAAGRPGLALKARNEQDAVNESLGNCVKHDSDSHVIAIGPFAVGPN
jgi:class 3 adenylate cyclase